MTGTVVRSLYVAVRDGTRLAVYLFERADRTGPAPVVWTHDRYHQVSPGDQRDDHVAAVRRRLGDPGIEDLGITPVALGEVSLRSFPVAERLVEHGYVVAVVDSRGSGASFGVSDGPFAPVEAADMYDVTEWLAAQPWCTGRVGMFGRSYAGVSQYLAAAAAPPHLAAIFPQMALFDLYAFAYDGGVFRADFAREWGADVRRLDLSDHVAPLDDDPDGLLLAAARAEHRANRDVHGMFAALPLRDSALADTGERPYASRTPSALVDSVNASGVAVYHLGGWYDVWARDATRWAGALRGPHKVVIGPWPHTGGIMGGHGYNLAEEHLRWFDHWLKGVDNGVMDGPPIRYRLDTTPGAPQPDGWSPAGRWPPADTAPEHWHLRADGTLATAPGERATRVYTVDYTTTSGRASRWSSGYGAPFDYPDMAVNDAAALCYDSPALTGTFDLVGAPVLRLELTDPQPGTDLFAYLESVGPDGVSSYVTEGCLRTGDDRETTVELYPTAYRFPAGARIRLALAGADADNAETTVRTPAPVLTLRHGPDTAATLTLPSVRPSDDVERTAPITAAQRAIWLAEQGGDAGWSYHLGVAYEAHGPLDTTVLAAAVDEIVERHSALRTTFEEAGGEPVQRVHAPAPLRWTRIDLRSSQDAETDAWTADAKVHDVLHRPFDLAREWPVRVATVRLPADRTGLVLVVHHLVADPVAAQVFFTELAQLYAAFGERKPSPLAPAGVQYADLAHGERAAAADPAAQAELARALTTLAGAPATLTLPLDRPRPTTPDFAAGTVGFTLQPRSAREIERLAARARTSVFGVLSAALAHTLGVFGAGEDIVFGTPALRRDREEHRGVVGCLVNMVPIRVRLAQDATVLEHLDHVRTAVLHALALQSVPFDTLVAAARPDRDPAIQPLVQATLRFGTPVDDVLHLGGTALRRIGAGTPAAKFDLALSVDTAGGGYRGVWHYRTALFDPATVTRISEVFTGALDSMTAEPSGRMAELDPVSRAERGRMFQRWQPPGLAEELSRHLPRRATGLPSRCYVLDALRRPIPVGAVGELYIAVEEGTADGRPDPFRANGAGLIAGTGLRARWTPDGRITAEAPASAPPVPQDAEPGAGQELVDEVASIWADLLNVGGVGADDDFFDLGGDSLFAIRLIGRVRRAFGVRLALKDVYSAATPAHQALLIEQRRTP